LRDAVISKAFHRGLLTLSAGENAIRMSPPLLIDDEQADFAIRTFEECLREVEKAV